MAKRKEILAEFIPYGGVTIGGGFEPKRTLKRAGFRRHFESAYRGLPARFGKAVDRGVKGWGIFIPVASVKQYWKGGK